MIVTREVGGRRSAGALDEILLRSISVFSAFVKHPAKIFFRVTVLGFQPLLAGNVRPVTLPSH